MYIKYVEQCLAHYKHYFKGQFFQGNFLVLGLLILFSTLFVEFAALRYQLVWLLINFILHAYWLSMICFNCPFHVHILGLLQSFILKPSPVPAVSMLSFGIFIYLSIFLLYCFDIHLFPQICYFFFHLILLFYYLMNSCSYQVILQLDAHVQNFSSFT